MRTFLATATFTAKSKCPQYQVNVQGIDRAAAMTVANYLIKMDNAGKTVKKIELKELP